MVAVPTRVEQGLERAPEQVLAEAAPIRVAEDPVAAAVQVQELALEQVAALAAEQPAVVQAHSSSGSKHYIRKK